MLRSRLETTLPDPPAALLPFLIPFSALYGGISALHRSLYRSGIAKSRRLPRPVVSVGNLAVGGGGKTPLTMWVAQRMMASGLRVAVLTRGYGRANRDLRFVSPDDDWRAVGDEPALMAGKIDGLTVAVLKNRFRAGMEALKRSEVDLFLLDDGLQHYALERDLDILVVDNGRRFGNGRLLPAGILRGPLSRLQDADFIVVTRAQGEDPRFEDDLKRYSQAEILWADYQPSGLWTVGETGPASRVEDLPGRLLAFSGIAGPEGFRETLKKAGIEVLDLMAFPDHHPYSTGDVRRILDRARQLQAAGLVTTEKDAVRWPAGETPFPVYSLSLRTEVKKEKVLLDRLLALARGEQAHG